MKLANTGRRLRQIRQYAALGYSPLDSARLAVLGVARGHPFASKDIWSWVGRTLFPELVVRPAMLGGLRLSLDPSDVTHMVIFDEIIVENNYDMELVPFPPDQIYDCGGHIGMFSLLATSRFPGTPTSIFEPNPRNVTRIRRQIELNSLAIEVRQEAVSVRAGEATFEDRASFSGHLLNNIEAVKADAVATPRYAVRVIDFPQIVRARDSKKLLLKLDIEGEEANVLPALLQVLPQTTAIFFETHDGESGWDLAARQFRDRGFDVQRRRQWEFCVDGFALRI
jgi:FkbM family methyltransferase